MLSNKDLSDSVTLDIFMPSTALNLLLSILIALDRKQKFISSYASKLIFIDQNKQYNPIITALRKQSNPIFTKIDVLPAEKGTLGNKLKIRDANFLRLQELIITKNFANIFVGNDKRIEFQYAMYYRETKGEKSCGHYMDDGLFSYCNVLLESRGLWRYSAMVLQRYLSEFFKKNKYPWVISSDMKIANTSLISLAWLLRPDSALKHLKQKHIVQVPIHILTSDKIKLLAQEVLQNFKLNNIEYLICLPHIDEIKYNNTIKQTWKNVINLVLERLSYKPTKFQRGKMQKKRKVNMYDKIAIKLHPSTNLKELQGLIDSYKDKRLLFLQQELPIEIILPILPAKSKIVTDFSSSVGILVKLLKPKQQVICLTSSAILKRKSKLLQLFKSQKVSLLPYFNLQSANFLNK